MTDRELKDQRVVTMMTPSELEAIDDWMFKNRIRSRGEAIRQIVAARLSEDAERETSVAHIERFLVNVCGLDGSIWRPA